MGPLICSPYKINDKYFPLSLKYKRPGNTDTFFKYKFVSAEWINQ